MPRTVWNSGSRICSSKRLLCTVMIRSNTRTYFLPMVMDSYITRGYSLPEIFLSACAQKGLPVYRFSYIHVIFQIRHGRRRQEIGLGRFSLKCIIFRDVRSIWSSPRARLFSLLRILQFDISWVIIPKDPVAYFRGEFSSKIKSSYRVSWWGESIVDNGGRSKSTFTFLWKYMAWAPKINPWVSLWIDVLYNLRRNRSTIMIFNHDISDPFHMQGLLGIHSQDTAFRDVCKQSSNVFGRPQISPWELDPFINFTENKFHLSSSVNPEFLINFRNHFRFPHHTARYK